MLCYAVGDASHSPSEELQMWYWEIIKVQMRATKLITEIRHLDYEEGPELLNLQMLKYRPFDRDIILVFKVETVM
jgi:hypothetical protein